MYITNLNNLGAFGNCVTRMGRTNGAVTYVLERSCVLNGNTNGNRVPMVSAVTGFVIPYIGRRSARGYQGLLNLVQNTERSGWPTPGCRPKGSFHEGTERTFFRRKTPVITMFFRDCEKQIGDMIQSSAPNVFKIGCRTVVVKCTNGMGRIFAFNNSDLC